MKGLVVGKYKAAEFCFVGLLTRPAECIFAGENYQPVNLFVVQFIRKLWSDFNCCVCVPKEWLIYANESSVQCCPLTMFRTSVETFFVPVVKAENHWAAFFVVNFIELNRECNTEKFQQLGGNSIQTVKQLSILSKHGTFFLERIWLSIFYQSL